MKRRNIPYCINNSSNNLAIIVILTVIKNNPMKVKKTMLKGDVRAFQDELNLYISNYILNFRKKEIVK